MLTVAHNLYSEEKGSQAAPSMVLSAIYRQQVWERGWWVYVSGAVWYSPTIAVQERRGHREEVTGKHKWEKSVCKPHATISMQKENFDFKIVSSFWFPLEFCPSSASLIRSIVYLFLPSGTQFTSASSCSAGLLLQAAKQHMRGSSLFFAVVLSSNSCKEWVVSN